ncbi:hypothetical protein C8P68_102524 [Mucilaginibacter yixingensis]|uniref:Uncharacterized protein n=1 Tax=Mucilaginibacter yixingensis TaxID=1295612 RepID=A0A2T5JDF2_9SPHI|nr:hypothetical protein C8P68_102524 [Mucilaginibacter yixingensis]
MKAAWNNHLIAKSDNISYIKTAFNADSRHAKSAARPIKHQPFLKGTQVIA